jgi:hypothetical protein
LAILAAEVMTVTNPLAFQTVLGWPGLQTIARFHYCSYFRVWILHCAGAPCGGIGVWALGKGECTFISQQPPRTCTHSSQNAPRRAMPSSLHVIEARLYRQVDSLARMGQLRHEIEVAREHLVYLPIVFQPSPTTWTDSLNTIKLLNRLTLAEVGYERKA